MINLRMRFAAISALCLFFGAPATAGEWFQHKFGELRSVHGDWLAVCADNGAGACRIVHAGKDPGSDAFFDYRMSLHFVEGLAAWNVQVMDRGMPYRDVTEVTFDFDGEWLRLPPKSWVPGEPGFDNVAETFHITDADITESIAEHMRAGNMLTIVYRPEGDGNGFAQFPLRGVTSAMEAVERHVFARGN